MKPIRDALNRAHWGEVGRGRHRKRGAECHPTSQSLKRPQPTLSRSPTIHPPYRIKHLETMKYQKDPPLWDGIGTPDTDDALFHFNDLAGQGWSDGQVAPPPPPSVHNIDVDSVEPILAPKSISAAQNLSSITAYILRGDPPRSDISKSWCPPSQLICTDDHT